MLTISTSLSIRIWENEEKDISDIFLMEQVQ